MKGRNKMNEILQALILGVVQGLTELLPISSSAHLNLLPWIFNWEMPPSFDVARLRTCANHVHAGSESCRVDRVSACHSHAGSGVHLYHLSGSRNHGTVKRYSELRYFRGINARSHIQRLGGSGGV